MMTFPLALSQFDYATAGIYLLASLFLGLMAGGKQKDLKTYLLADNRMHWALIAISVLAALFSGISFIGAPSENFSHNMVYIWVLIAFFVATPITNYLFLPFFFRLPFYTAYEYLEHRFDLKLRRISSGAFIVRVCFWLALAQFAPSLVITEMTGIPLWVAIAVTGGVTILYTTIGGMRAVIYTDVMQFGVMMLGILAVLWVALGKIPDGLPGAWEIAHAGGRTEFFNFSWSLTERMTVLGAFVGGMAINLVALVTDQVAVQRYLTASDLRSCQRALWFKLYLTLPLVGLFHLTGLILYAFYQVYPDLLAGLSGSDRILPFFVAQNLFSPLPGLFLAAILAATMSTVSAGINSLTTATLIDFTDAGRQESATQAEEQLKVRTARRWTVFYGLLTTLLALVVSKLGTVLEASNKISGFFGGPLLGIFILGVFSQRANARGTFVGALTGFVSVVALWWLTAVSFMWYALFGTVITCAVGLLASYCFPAPTLAQRRFSRREMATEATVPGQPSVAAQTSE